MRVTNSDAHRSRVSCVEFLPRLGDAELRQSQERLLGQAMAHLLLWTKNAAVSQAVDYLREIESPKPNWQQHSLPRYCNRFCPQAPIKKVKKSLSRYTYTCSGCSGHLEEGR